MFKSLLRTFLREAGYSIQRIAPPSLPPSPVRSPPLQAVDVELFPGWPATLDLSDHPQRHALRVGADYEAPSPRLLRTFCGTPGCVFFDIGANFGFFSHYLLSQCPRLVVHSFEPNLVHVERHRATAAALAPGRFFPHHLGLSDAAGELELVVSSVDSGWSTFGPNPHFAGQEATLSRQKAPLERFDAWCTSMNLQIPPEPVWVAKIDVEGFEPRVLRGMERALQAHAFKAILIEVLDHTLNFCGHDAGQIFDLFTSAGYTPFDTSLEPTSRQTKEERNVLFLPLAK